MNTRATVSANGATRTVHEPYYVGQTMLKHGRGACPIGQVPAGEIEAAVIDQLRAVFRQPEIVAGTWKAARAQDGDITEAAARAALQQIDPLWDELFPAEQARIVALLIERADIGTRGLHCSPSALLGHLM